jgi:hypothetical protein
MEMYRAMLSRMSIEEYAPEDFDRWLGDKLGMLEAVSDTEDRDEAVALMELIALNVRSTMVRSRLRSGTGWSASRKGLASP